MPAPLGLLPSEALGVQLAFTVIKSPHVILRGREHWLRKLANTDAESTQKHVLAHDQTGPLCPR